MAITREELSAGTPYRVVEAGFFNKDDIIYLVYDDGSTCPKFNRDKDADRYHGSSCYVGLSTIEKVRKFKVGDIVKRSYYYKILAVTDYGYVTTVKSDSVAEAEAEREVDETLLLNSSVEGFSLVTKETELTLEQIAKKFNIDVANLRIKE